MLLPTDDERALRAACRELLADRTTSERIRGLVESPDGHDADLWKQTAELGWTALAVPARLDGLGGGVVELAVLTEEFGRALQPSPLAGTSAAAWALARADTRAADELAAVIATGDAIVSWSVERPDEGGRVTAREESGRTLLDGRRRFVADAQVATHLLVDVQAEASRPLAVVETMTAGLRLRPHGTLDLTRRFQEAHFDRVAVRRAALLDPATVTNLFHVGVVLQCAESVGVAARLLEMTVAYVKQRTQFGRAIGSFQAIKHRIADMYMALEGARAATRHAAEAVQGARPDAALAVHVAKSWTAPAANAIAGESLQLHGGIGFTWEHDLHLFLRRAKANELLLGTPAWHDEQIVQLVEGRVA
jgi:alkylation response protein AidB-like acyl-CoA dehydrogenase